jgi:hypothetical protein
MPMIDLRFLTKQTQHFWFGTTKKELGPDARDGPEGSAVHVFAAPSIVIIVDVMGRAVPHRLSRKQLT